MTAIVPMGRRPRVNLGLDLRGIFVNRAFLLDAIRYYSDHPDARQGVGTEDGLQQLLGAVPAGR